MDQQKQEILEKLQSSNNILVTVSSNPSVDQLAACIGLTLLLNKLDKHATAVFSGQIPSTIEFLKPEDTIETNTDSLRDFIIALDKTKADKLRYKVEDRVVKIFITPYRTSLSADDLNFSQGDFNIDVVLALGVHQQADLDEAITAHGRILHDATVACINNSPKGDLGTINWAKPDASSLSELVVELAKSFEQPLLDEQIATALLTGIVAETDRFRNEKTTAATMTLSADLMNAGANQKLVAEELEQPALAQPERQPTEEHTPEEKREDRPVDKPVEPPKPKRDDGTLEIAHDKHKDDTAEPAPHKEGDKTAAPEQPSDSETPHPEPTDSPRSLITEAPSLGGSLTANTLPEDAHYDPSIDPLAGAKGGQPILSHDNTPSTPKSPVLEPPKPAEDAALAADQAPAAAGIPQLPKVSPLPPPPTEPSIPMPAPEPPVQPAAAPRPFTPPQPTPPKHETLTELEEAVDSPHANDSIDAVEKARQEVLRAINEQPDTKLEPVQALNAQSLDLGKHDHAEPPKLTDNPLPPASPQVPSTPAPLPPNIPDPAPFSTSPSPADQPLTMPMPPGINLPPPQVTPPGNAPQGSPNAAPPVPPPLMPPNWPPKQ